MDGRLDQAIGSMWTTWRFWWLRGHVTEIARVWQRIAARQADLAPRTRALALAGIAFSFFADHDLDRAQAAFAQSVPLFRAAGDPLRGAQAAAHLGHVLAEKHDESQAADALAEARSLLRDADTDTGRHTEPERMLYLLGTALAGNFEGQIQLGHGDDDRAGQLFTAALDAARRASDQFTILISLYDLALSDQARGDLDAAGDTCGTGWRWPPKPAISPPPPTTWRPRPPWPASRTTRPGPPRCWPRPPPGCRPAAAAGCRPTSRALPTVPPPRPNSAPSLATRPTSRPRPRDGAGPREVRVSRWPWTACCLMTNPRR